MFDLTVNNVTEVIDDDDIVIRDGKLHDCRGKVYDLGTSATICSLKPIRILVEHDKRT